MRYLLASIVLFLTTSFVSAQDASLQKEEVKKVVETFFEGFHARDSVLMKSVFYSQPVIQTLGKDAEGETLLVQDNLEKLLKGIVSIPLEIAFKEVIHNYDIKIDGNMANAWTSYSFYLNEEFSHCGVNSFQLIREKEEWKIIYLIDTRRKQNCFQNSQD